MKSILKHSRSGKLYFGNRCYCDSFKNVITFECQDKMQLWWWSLRSFITNAVILVLLLQCIGDTGIVTIVFMDYQFWVLLLKSSEILFSMKMFSICRGKKLWSKSSLVTSQIFFF